MMILSRIRGARYDVIRCRWRVSGFKSGKKIESHKSDQFQNASSLSWRVSGFQSGKKIESHNSYQFQHACSLSKFIVAI